MRESRSPLKRAALSVALSLALAPFAAAQAQQAPTDPSAPASDTRHAQDTASDSHIKDLGGVVVTASALQDTADTLSKPVEVLTGERLDVSRAARLVENLS